MKKVLKIIVYTIAILLIIRFTYPLILPVYQIATDSMEPTISKGDYVMVSKLHYKFFDPNRDDIVMFKPVDGVFSAGPWTHRIIGISGDVVIIQDGFVTVNGNKTFFPEIVHENLETTVEEGHVFQKGDNRKTIAVELPEDEIIGKVIYNFSKNNFQLPPNTEYAVSLGCTSLHPYLPAVALRAYYTDGKHRIFLDVIRN